MVVAAMTAQFPALVAGRRRPPRTHIRVSDTRIGSTRESCCTEEQHEGQRERAAHGLESVFHLDTPSSLNNLVILVLLRRSLNVLLSSDPRESQLPACIKGKECAARVSDGDFEKHEFTRC